jgi:hypothetical protein
MATDSEVFLTEDPAVPGQKFTLLSFLSPERVLEKKDMFFFEAFLKTYEFTTRTKSLETFLMGKVRDINDKLEAEAVKFDAKDLSGVADVCRAARIQVGTIMEELQTYVKKNTDQLKVSQLKEQYDDFLFVKRTELEDKFYAVNDFKTTVRGLKIRGTYGTHEEAVARARRLQKLDPVHNIFVAEVGKWLPWDPETSEVKDQEYAEDQLNTLMKKYKENEESREAVSSTLREQHDRVKKRGVVPMEASNEQLSESVPDMFGTSGPADLSIQYKLDNAKKEESKKD